MLNCPAYAPLTARQGPCEVVVASYATGCPTPVAVASPYAKGGSSGATTTN